MKFYLAREGVAFGPYSEFQLLESIRLGIFDKNDLALAEDGKEWLEVARLLPAAASPAAPAGNDRSRLDIPAASSARVSARRTPASTTARLTAALLGLLCLGGAVERLTPFTLAKSGPVAPKPLPSSRVQIKPAANPRAHFQAAILADTMTMPPAADLLATPADVELPPSAPAEQDGIRQAPSRRIEGQVAIEATDGLDYRPSSIAVRLYPLPLLKSYLQERHQAADARFEDLKSRLAAAEVTKERLRRASDQAFDAYILASAGSPDKAVLEQANAEAKKAREQAANAYYGLLQDRQDSLSGAFYLEDLPKAADAAQTDGEGRFAFEVPAEGEFAVVAGVESGAGAGTRRYYWFVPVCVGEEPRKDVLLSNNNLSSQGSTESLIQTAD